MKFIEYKDIRDSIETGDVFLTANPARFSKIIRFFTRSKVSHAGMFLKIGERNFIVESLEGKGIRMMLASVRFNEPFVHLRPRKIPSNFMELALENLGGDYDLKGALLSVFRKSDKKSFFCSEFVAYCLELDFEALDRDPTPIDIYNKLA